MHMQILENTTQLKLPIKLWGSSSGVTSSIEYLSIIITSSSTLIRMYELERSVWKS